MGITASIADIAHVITVWIKMCVCSVTKFHQNRTIAG